MMRSGCEVWSAPKYLVDSTAMMAIPAATGHHALSQNRGPRGQVFVRGVENLAPRRLFDMIVGRFASDDHVVDVTLAQARAGDAHKLRLLLQLRDTAASQVAHAGAQSADKLKHHRLQRSAIRHAALDSLGNKLGQAIFVGALALHYVRRAALRVRQIG